MIKKTFFKIKENVGSTVNQNEQLLEHHFHPLVGQVSDALLLIMISIFLS